MTMQDDLVDLARIKEMIKALELDKAEVEAHLIAALVQKGQKTVTSNDVTGTLVAGTRITIDEEKLKTSLPAPLWKKVTRQVLDKEKLEAHIVTGDIDPNIVAAASTEKDVKPYVKVSGSFKAAGPIAPKNSAGGTKPGARKRVVKPAKPSH